MEARLQLHTDPGVIGAATNFAYTWGYDAGLPPEKALRWALAVNELVTDIVRFAFRHEQGTFTLIFRRDLTSVELVARELGEPFDPERHQYDPERARAEGDFNGAGLHLMRHLVDDFVFLNRGRDGKEFQLVEFIPSEHIDERALELPPASTETEPSETDYHLSLATPADAEDIAKLIYRTYGYSYAKEALYFPEQIARALRQGDKFAVIVRTDAGEPVGSFAVLRSTDSEVGEVGEAVVTEGHRRRGLMTRMLDRLIDEAKTRGLQGAFGEAVTVHDISQRVNQHFGMQSTALLLATFRIQRFRGFVDEYPQPVSIVIDFRPLIDVDSVTAYLPEPYADLLTDIYADLGIAVTTPPVPPPAYPPTSTIDVHINHRDRHATLVVETFGTDFIEQVEQTIKDLRDENLHVVYVDLPLDDPGTLDATPRLREHEFVLAGLMPMFHQQRDFLRMQRLLVDLDFDLIQVYSDRAHVLKETIREELEWNTHTVTTR
jgi:anti-sigma regulatory factor (Ser/Thr protein kinase)/GNAT superfamily N-acetyltransferase